MLNSKRVSFVLVLLFNGIYARYPQGNTLKTLSLAIPIRNLYLSRSLWVENGGCRIGDNWEGIEGRRGMNWRVGVGGAGDISERRAKSEKDEGDVDEEEEESINFAIRFCMNVLAMVRLRCILC